MNINNPRICILTTRNIFDAPCLANTSLCFKSLLTLYTGIVVESKKNVVQQITSDTTVSSLQMLVR